MPASASSTTSASNAATPAAPPTRCSTRSQTRSNSTTPSGPPVRPRPRHEPRRPTSAAALLGAAGTTGPAADPRLDLRPRRSATAAATTSPPTPLGRALYAPLFESREQPPNSARFTFLDPAAARVLRRLGAMPPRPRRTPALRGRTQPVRPRAQRPHRRAVHPQRPLPQVVGSARCALPPDRDQTPRHPIVGDLELNYEVMPIPGDNLRLAIFTTEIGSRSAHAIDLFSSWSATTPVDAATRGTS